MNNYLTRPLGALAAAAALILAGLAVTGQSGEAAASTGFYPFTASFTSPSWGVALGSSDCAAGQACPAQLQVTADGGGHWRAMPAPNVQVEGNAPGKPIVDQVVFANHRDGWLYGAGGAWYTSNGGGRWQRLQLEGTPRAMAASAKAAYAVVEPSNGSRAKLLTSPIGRVAWVSADGITASYTALTVHGSAAWLAGATNLWATADGVHWHHYGLRCPAPPGERYYPAGLAATSASRLAILCAGNSAMGQEVKEVLLSSDGGKTVKLGGQAPSEGMAGLIAVTPGHPDWITVTAGVSLDYSRDGGRTWIELNYAQRGVPWGYLAFVSESTGWASCGWMSQSDEGGLLKTSNSGRSWHWVLR